MMIRQFVSIHARTRAGDKTERTITRRARCFNPRPHACGRRPSTTPRPSVAGVSIHARTRAGDGNSSGATDSGVGFNPRPHACGRLRHPSARNNEDVFQSTPARVRATATTSAPDVAGAFQSTPARVRATWRSWGSRRRTRCFNPRPHACGRQRHNHRHPFGQRFQSTPARVRATRHTIANDQQPIVVSIHARTRAGDSLWLSITTPHEWFQSTPARVRATCPTAIASTASSSFNPRPHACGRRSFITPFAFQVAVSIHARTRAGDLPPQVSRGSRPCFNPRPHACGRPCRERGRSRWQRVSIHARTRAGDASATTCLTSSGSFQSTPARVRATLPSLAAAAVPLSFNPRPHACGRLWISHPIQKHLDVSIHARTRAGDQDVLHHLLQCLLFQSTPARVRATRNRCEPAPSNFVFQSTPARVRATRYGEPVTPLHTCFNPRPHACGRPPTHNPFRTKSQMPPNREPMQRTLPSSAH